MGAKRSTRGPSQETSSPGVYAIFSVSLCSMCTLEIRPLKQSTDVINVRAGSRKGFGTEVGAAMINPLRLHTRLMNSKVVSHRLLTHSTMDFRSLAVRSRGVSWSGLPRMNAMCAISWSSFQKGVEHPVPPVAQEGQKTNKNKNNNQPVDKLGHPRLLSIICQSRRTWYFYY